MSNPFKKAVRRVETHHRMSSVPRTSGEARGITVVPGAPGRPRRCSGFRGMARMFARAVAAGVFLLVVMGNVPGVGDDPGRPTLLLRVTDFAPLSRQTRDRAAPQASVNYGTAGVDAS